MIQLSTQPPTGLLPGVRAAGFPLGTTSDFALALAQLAGAPGGLASPPGLTAPVALSGDPRQGIAGSGNVLPEIDGVAEPVPTPEMPSGLQIPLATADEVIAVTVAPEEDAEAAPVPVEVVVADVAVSVPSVPPPLAAVPQPVAAPVEPGIVARAVPARRANIVTTAANSPTPAAVGSPVGLTAPSATVAAPTVRTVANVVGEPASKSPAAVSTTAPAVAEAPPPQVAAPAAAARQPRVETPAPTTEAPPSAATTQSQTAIRPPLASARPAPTVATPAAVVPLEAPADPIAAVAAMIDGAAARVAPLPNAVLQATPGVTVTPRSPEQRPTPDPAVMSATPHAVEVAPAAMIPEVMIAQPESRVAVPTATARIESVPNSPPLVATPFVGTVPTAPVTMADAPIMQPIGIASAISAPITPAGVPPVVTPNDVISKVAAPPAAALPAAMPTVAAPPLAMPTVAPPSDMASPIRAPLAAAAPAAAAATASVAAPVIASVLPQQPQPIASISAAPTPVAATAAPIVTDTAATTPVPVTVTVTTLPVAPPPAPQLQPASQAFAAAMFAAAAPVDRRDERGEDALPLTIASGSAPTAAQAPAFAVAAAGQGQQPTLDMTKADWLASMIDRIETLRDESGGIRETRMKLAPEALGNVEVTVRRDESGVLQVRIAADTAQARAMLSDAAPKLAEMVEARGLKLGGSSVDAGAGDQRRDAPAPTPATRRPASAATDTTTTMSDATSDTRLA